MVANNALTRESTCFSEEEFGKQQSNWLARGAYIMMCTNKERGCEWQGKLFDLTNHLGNSDGCQFEDMKCSNECGKMLQRQYLTSHVETECPRRKVDCQYCHITGEHQFIEGEHKEHCPKLPLSCPNKCKIGNVLREDMEAHRKECPLEMVQCEYHNVKFKETMTRIKCQLIKASECIRNEKHPVIYLDIERKLLELGKAVITTNEFHSVATKSGFSAAKQSEEFKGALAYFHSKGTILHFPFTKLLQNLVVLSPQWLAKVISYVIVAHPYRVSASRHDEQYRRLQCHGILVDDFIAHMTQRFNKDQAQLGVSLSIEQVISLVKHFKLVAQTNKTHFSWKKTFSNQLNPGMYLLSHRCCL